MADFTGNLYSKVLGMNTAVRIITPKRRNHNGPFRAVYLLHGLSDNSTDWVLNTRCSLLAQDYDVMLIIPEVQKSFYIDMAEGAPYFTYITQELPQLVETLFRVSPKREDRYVMGISMGGYGALRCALTYPERYAGCAAFSPACDIRLVMEACRMETPMMPLGEVMGIVGREVLEQFLERPELLAPYDLFELARKQDENPEKPRLFVTCGTEDFIHQMSLNLAKAMEPLHYDFTYLEWPGIHEWYFWDESVHLAFEHFFGPGSAFNPYSLEGRKRGMQR